MFTIGHNMSTQVKISWVCSALPKKSKLVPPTTRYINIIKQGYKDCKINIKSLNVALVPVKHLQR